MRIYNITAVSPDGKALAIEGIVDGDRVSKWIEGQGYSIVSKAYVETDAR